MKDESQDKIEEVALANALISYVNKNPQANLLKGEGRGEEVIPDHWVLKGEGASAVPGLQCLVSHGLFDLTFERTTVKPSKWNEFERQYLSPEADLLERMYEECNRQTVAGWQPKPMGERRTIGRNHFPMTKDFWTNKTQNENFNRILVQLANANLVTRATRYYADDPRAFGVRIGEKVVDFPGSFWNLRSVAGNLQTGMRSGSDIPQDFDRYDSTIPVLYMLANTVEVWDERPNSTAYADISPRQKLYKLVSENTGPTPKMQSIAYVLAEKKEGGITPRHVGKMDFFMLEVFSRTPCGARRYERSYMVPQCDLTEEEEKSLDCSQSNWEIHHPGILENHPQLKNELGL